MVLTGGGRAYLKVTAADAGRARAEAERELRFYRGVAPASPVSTPELLDVLLVDEGVALLLEDAGEQLAVTAWSRDLEELAILVFPWPPYTAYNGPAGTARVRRRARDLAERLSG